jgi:hypothetical protein
MPDRRPRSPVTLLRALEALKTSFGPEPAARKSAGLRALERASLPRPGEVLRLHELLCFWRAYPDDPRILAIVERMLAAFARRPDLRRHARRLENSGVAGTSIRFRFFAPTALWLAERWPDRLRVDWKSFEHADRLATWLPQLVLDAEIPALDEYDLPLRAWLRRLKGPREAEGAFLVRSLARVPMSEGARETFYDELDPPLVLEPGVDTPSRTLAAAPGAGRAGAVFQDRPLSRERPAPTEVLRLEPAAVRNLSPREGRRFIDLARASMVTRERDLDVFSYGDPADVRLVDFEGGLQFACIGALPERRLLLEAVYGYLTLKNGVPVGYVLTSALFGSSEIAYNVFDSFRGAEAGGIYARVLAMTRYLFGSDTFTIFPYQLGEGNDEATASGAWWFYQKMGFRPRDPATLRLMRRELAKAKRSPRHRSSLATLRRLARQNLYLPLARERDDVIGRIELPNVGLQVIAAVAKRFGAGREGADTTCAREAANRLGVRSFAGWSRAERDAWRRWAPLTLILPGLARWSPAERGALVEVVRAKGGRRESDFVRRFDGHRRLRAAIRKLAVDPER